MTTDITPSHEIVELFNQYQIPLSEKIIKMLNEDYSHQTERRGCGYTQATRVLATYINIVRDPESFDDLQLFEYSLRNLRLVMSHAPAEHLELKTWRDLDLRQDLLSLLADPIKTAQNATFFDALNDVIRFQHQLRHIINLLKLEESLVLVRLLIDIILPYPLHDLTTLAPLPEKPKVGSCTMAEKFFLEIAYGSIPRRGRVNIIVDANKQPLLIEKLNMGDSHSCISVVPLIMNGVRLPAGSLFAVDYATDLEKNQDCKQIAGKIIPLTQCTGFCFLRLTTLCVSPTNRARAFSAHLAQQVTAGLFSCRTTEISQLLTVAKAQL